MKKLFFLLPTLLVILISCNNKKEADDKVNNNDNKSTDNRGIEKPKEYDESVIGKWDVVEMNMSDMDQEEKEDAEKNANIEFRKDGTYKSMDSDGADGGNYTYDEEGKLLTITSDQHGETNVAFKVSWDGSDMVLKGDGGNVKLRRN